MMETVETQELISMDQLSIVYSPLIEDGMSVLEKGDAFLARPTFFVYGAQISGTFSSEDATRSPTA